MDRAEEVSQVFREYHARQGLDRNDAYRNAGVRLQNLYSDLSLVDALASTGVDRDKAEVLDVGAGSGGSLAAFMALGFPYQSLHGVDVVPEYIAEGQQRWPQLDLRVMDGTALAFPEASFDIVTASAIFVQMMDDAVARRIGAEMVRVLKPAGYLVVRDWWFPHPNRQRYRPLNGRRRAVVFPANLGIKLQGSFRGPLVPPLGRFLSLHARWLYGPLHGLLPFLAAQTTWVWHKQSQLGLP
jgi:SAM-dependent methyltransferase